MSGSMPGTLDVLILRTLSLRDLHAYGLAQYIRQSCCDQVLFEEGSLYPALQRLQLNGWIDAMWGATSDHRRAKIYRITSAGSKQLKTLTFHPYTLPVEDAPALCRKGVRSCLLFGSVVTGVAFGQQPARNPPSRGIPVNVCLEPTQELPISTTRAATSFASVIFSQIGVNLTWHMGLADCDDLSARSVRAFKIQWASHAPATAPGGDGALAAAHPFGSPDVSITIYEVPLDRFLRHYPNAPDLVLAYVLAHELAHVMQRLDYHSASGILAPSWSCREYHRMLSGTLAFTAHDVDLIHAGLEAKKSNMASREGAPQNRSASSSEP